MNWKNLNENKTGELLSIIKIDKSSFIPTQKRDRFFLLKQKSNTSKTDKKLIIQEIKFTTHEELQNASNHFYNSILYHPFVL
ncbi:MAG: hypothetical protein HC830_07425 [Bacteroidetes bacterium]|nr:hypothetical protein [Bacteroidota bacterium]